MLSNMAKQNDNNPFGGLSKDKGEDEKFDFRPHYGKQEPPGTWEEFPSGYEPMILTSSSEEAPQLVRSAQTQENTLVFVKEPVAKQRKKKNG